MPGINHPLVSVIMPYYNGQKYMAEAVDSVLGQTYKNIEVIVIDDASPGKQESEFIKNLSIEKGFKLITHETNQGIGPTLADGACASSGEYIAELSQDDLYKPDKIEIQVSELTSKNLDAVYSIGDILYEDSNQVVARDAEKILKIINSGCALSVLKQKNLSGISIQGLLAKRSIFETDIIPIWRDFLLDDWPVNIRLFEKYNVGVTHIPHWTNRTHSQSTSRNLWKWLGPQIEVVARMTPEDSRIVGIGNRLASFARRLLKQNADPDSIIRLATAALMLTETNDQLKKASRILNKLSSKHKKNIITNKLKLIKKIVDCGDNNSGQEVTNIGINTDWNNIGKNIAIGIEEKTDANKLCSISANLYSLSFYLLSSDPPNQSGINLLLASLILTDNSDEEHKIIRTIQSFDLDCNKLIKEKYQILKGKSGRSIRTLWLN